MTTEETRTRLRQLEDRLGERTPPPIEGQTRIPIAPGDGAGARRRAGEPHQDS